MMVKVCQFPLLVSLLTTFGSPTWMRWVTRVGRAGNNETVLVSMIDSSQEIVVAHYFVDFSAMKSFKEGIEGR